MSDHATRRRSERDRQSTPRVMPRHIRSTARIEPKGTTEGDLAYFGFLLDREFYGLPLEHEVPSGRRGRVRPSR